MKLRRFLIEILKKIIENKTKMKYKMYKKIKKLKTKNIFYAILPNFTCESCTFNLLQLTLGKN